MFNNRFGIFPFVLILFVLALPLFASAENHKRDNWYVGFGLGAGLDARYTYNGKDITFDDWLNGTNKSPKVAINFKIGGTLSPNTLLGFDATAVRQEGTYGANGKDSIQINNYFVMLTHFPNEEGFFLRGGGGLSNLKIETESNGTKYSDTVNGYGLLGGVGYAFWLGKSFNLTLNLDHSRQFYSNKSYQPDKSQFTILYLGFDWY